MCDVCPVEIKRLRQFLSVVDNGSFTIAAADCHLSQQGLSKSIATLEQSIGAPLFHRDTRGISLTQCGKLLVPIARNILADVRNFQLQLDELTGIHRGRVIVGAGFTSAGYLLSPLVRRIALKRPQLQITIVDGTAKELVPKLLAGELDLAICILNTSDKDPHLVQKSILEERVTIIVGRNHPLSGHSKVTLSETLKYPWLSWGMPQLHPGISEMLQKAGLQQPVPKLITTSILFGLTLLQDGDYVSSFSENLVQRELNSGTLVSVEIDNESGPLPSITTSLCYRKTSSLSQPVLLFIEELEKFVSDLDLRLK